MKYLGFIIVSVLSINTIFAQSFLPPTIGVLDFEPRGIPTYVSQQFTQLLREEIEPFGAPADSAARAIRLAVLLIH